MFQWIIVIVIVVVFVITVTSGNQMDIGTFNLIRNGSFETKEWNVLNKRPDKPGQTNFLEYWKDDSNNTDNPDPNPGGIPRPKIDFNSPDWIDNSDTDFFNLYESKTPLSDPTPSWTLVPAYAGDRFVAMGVAELIQQKLENKLVDGKYYLISVRFREFLRVKGDRVKDRKFGDYDHRRLDRGFICSDDNRLRAYISEKEIKYLSKHSWDEEKKHPGKIRGILDFSLNPTVDLDPLNVWREAKAVFQAPGKDFDWIAIEVFGYWYCSYLAIDDVFLTEYCLNGCSRTSGAIRPSPSGLINKDNPFKIRDLENLSYAKLDISNDAAGKNIVFSQTKSCKNGIADTLSWDGKNTNGAHQKNGAYFYKLTVKNDCCIETFTDMIIKYDDFGGVLDKSDSCNRTGVLTPMPCCELEPDIYIDNVTLSGPGKLEYLAARRIYIGTKGPVIVTNTAEIMLQAGQEIIYGEWLSIEDGADVQTLISPCPA